MKKNLATSSPWARIILLLIVLLVSSCISTSSQSSASTSSVSTSGSISSTTPVTSLVSYPIIPIPLRVKYYGFVKYSEDMATIGLYLDDSVFPTGSGATSYQALLKQFGWQTCQDHQWCNWPNVTDMNFHGTFVYGNSATAPRLTITSSAWPNTDQHEQMLFVTNCGKLTETKSPDLYGSRGCRILLPADQPDPATPIPDTLATPVGGSIPFRTPLPNSLVISPENAAQIKQYLVLNCRDGVLGVDFSPDSSQVVTGCWDKAVRLWSSQTGEMIRTLSGNTWFISGVAFSPDGQTVAAADSDGTVWVWNTNTGELQKSFGFPNPQGFSGWFRDIAYSPNGRLLAALWDTGNIRMWDLQSGELVRTFRGALFRGFNPDGQKLVTVTGGTSTGDGLQIWDVNTGNLLYVPNQSKPVESAVFSPDGIILAIAVERGNKDIPILIWDTSTDRLVQTLEGHQSGLSIEMAFSPNGRILATSSDDNMINVWDVLSGRLLITLMGHTAVITHIAFSPDGQIIASSSMDKTTRLWKVVP